MLFTSPIFAVFLPVALAAYWLSRGTTRRVLLLVFSYIFYAWWDWRFLGLLWISTLVDFHCARTMTDRPASRKRWLACSVMTNLGILATFKYFGFFAESVAAVLAQCGLDATAPTLQVILPMGISFYTFQTMSYTIDVYRGRAPEHDLLTFALYVACFPQLVAGPIMRANELLPQLATDRKERQIRLGEGLFRIVRGLIKKMILADALALYVDRVFDAPQGFAGFSSWIAMYAYAFQIYLDFSGYTDVAIGIGRLLGMRFPENFDRPYLARSPSEFWHRWHITLSRWLRDYLYIPLGGSRGGARRTARNLLITMALGGLWHGAAWTFVLWGVFHAMLLALHRAWRALFPPTGREGAGTRWLGIIVTFHLVCVGWVLFRAPDLVTAGEVLRNLVTFDGTPLHGLRILLIVLVCAAGHLLPAVQAWERAYARIPAAAQGAVFAAGLWAVLLLSPTARPFIYFQF